MFVVIVVGLINLDWDLFSIIPGIVTSIFNCECHASVTARQTHGSKWLCSLDQHSDKHYHDYERVIYISECSSPDTGIGLGHLTMITPAFRPNR